MVPGANTTWIAHLLPTAIVCPTQLSVSVKSPEMDSPLIVNGTLPLLVTVSVCAVDSVCTCCGPKVRLTAESVIAASTGGPAVSSGICQMPRPYVPARSIPTSLALPVGRFGAAASETTGEFGSDVPSTLQQFAGGVVPQLAMSCVTYTPVSSAT